MQRPGEAFAEGRPLQECVHKRKYNLTCGRVVVAEHAVSCFASSVDKRQSTVSFFRYAHLPHFHYYLKFILEYIYYNIKYIYSITGWKSDGSKNTKKLTVDCRLSTQEASRSLGGNLSYCTFVLRFFLKTLTCLADNTRLLRHAIFCVDGKESVSLSKQIHPFLFLI